MSASKSGAIHSAWESGIHFPASPRPSSTATRRRSADSTTGVRPSKPRVSTRPIADDVDLLGGLLFVLAFLAIVWL